ncbi:MAG TPA: APC family permease [Acidimicrobiales bacterium]|nr:APC family permease [Acidimicrobiales bacterium]
MAVIVEPANRAPEKGLKTGALGLVSSIVIAVASTAPAYSMAATLGFVVVAIGLQAPVVTILAFFPMWFISIAFQQMNKADPDCGASFTWATRAFNPRVGWMGGWGVIAADIIVMASLAQIAGQYVFDLFNASSIGNNATSPWVLTVGIAWIVAMTWICYVGIEISANFQKALLGIELTMLTVLSVWALVRVGNGSAPVGHLVPSGSWFDPFKIKHFSSFVVGLADMLFIYWGWDTALNLNEETKDAETVPGKAGVISTFILLGTYAMVILAVESFAGIGSSGIGLGNSAHANDVLSILGPAIFGHSTLASVLDHLLLLMVLSSAAASTQTTILPTARTALSMSVHKAIPQVFSKMHKRFLTPTVSTVTFGAVSIALYAVMNFLSAGNVISDSVSALGVMIAFYYGLTGFSCVWYYRKNLTASVHNFFIQGVLPLIGGLILYFILGWSFWYYWNPTNSYTTMKIFGHQFGGTFILDVGVLLLGLILMLTMQALRPAFFRGQTLTRNSPTLVTEDFATKTEQAH